MFTDSVEEPFLWSLSPCWLPKLIITINQGGVKSKHGEYISPTEMFVWIKGRPFLLVMDLTASICTHNKTHFFLYYFYYIGFWAWHSKSSPTSHTYLLVPIITLQVSTPKPIRHLLSCLCSGPYLTLGVPSPHLESYEIPSYLKARFCQVPHNLIFLFIFIIIPLLLQLSFPYSFLITLSPPCEWHTPPTATCSLALFGVCSI